jgi:hypothetical protein
MRETVRQLRRLQADLDALAERVDQATRPDSIDLLIRGLRGDTAAADELRALGAAGRAGRMHEMLDAILTPLEGADGVPVAAEDLIRPEGL